MPAPDTSTRSLSERLERYGHESGRPLTSLAFVTPMLLAYEGGLVWLGPQAMRNGADVWLRRLLEGLGFSQYFLLPLLTCGLLLAWHHLKRDTWRVEYGALHGMLFESLVLGIVLLLTAQGQRWLCASAAEAWAARPLPLALHGAAGAGVLAMERWVAFLGAGIYEELLFRLMLLPVLFTVLKSAGASTHSSWTAAVLAGSVLFAAAHYPQMWYVTYWRWNEWGTDSLAWLTFAFRILAGVFFSLLFLRRGFGVAVGTHAIYDILVAT